MSTLANRLAEALDGPPKRTQLELSAACGVSAPSVNDWISGKTKSIRSQYLLKAAKFLDVRFEWLATGVGLKFANLAVEEIKGIYTPKPLRDEHAKALLLLGRLSTENLIKLCDFAEFMLQKQEHTIVDSQAKELQNS